MELTGVRMILEVSADDLLRGVDSGVGVIVARPQGDVQRGR